MEAVESKELQVEKTIFQLRLGRKRSGAICEAFAEASDPQSAGAAVEKAKGEFFTAKSNKLKKGIPRELRELVDIVFAPNHSDLLQNIIVRFRLSFGSTHAYDELLNRI